MANLDVCQRVIGGVNEPFGKSPGESELDASVKRDHNPATTPIIASGDGMPCVVGSTAKAAIPKSICGRPERSKSENRVLAVVGCCHLSGLFARA
jgi:hypothetical protein